MLTIHFLRRGPKLLEDFMDFELGKEQREIKERAAEFADREVAPYAAKWDREARFPAEAFEKLAQVGFMGPGRTFCPTCCSSRRSAVPTQAWGRRSRCTRARVRSLS